MKKNKSTILIIFGISGDLARRYLLPSIEQIAKAKMLPKHFKIIGITRNLSFNTEKVFKNTSNKKIVQKATSFFEMDVNDKNEYEKLDSLIKKEEEKFGQPAQKLFYLSVPPKACAPIIQMLGFSGIAKRKDVKLLLEKPFGNDLKSAEELVKLTKRYFSEDKVYRIDHYLAKESVQNIITFRNGNPIFRKTWNNKFIERIDIIASENIDIEGRANFYEQTGALRDYVQSHLLQLTALTLMNLSDNCAINNIPKLRLNTLQKLGITCDLDKNDCVKRAQYEGYVKEVKNKHSKTETFVSLKLHSSDKNWRGVPIYITTGKALNRKLTEIRIKYKKYCNFESNELAIRIQPNPGIEFSVWLKKPGYEWEVSPHLLHFAFKEHYEKLPEAYEQVLFSAINSDRDLFPSGKEIIESWRILDIVQKAWKEKKYKLVKYKKGTRLEDMIK